MLALPALKSSCSLSLYVCGSSTTTHRTLQNLSVLCDAALPGNEEVLVIDVLEHPKLAEVERILCTPTLVKSSPGPARRVVGDLSNPEKILNALDLPPRFAKRPATEARAESVGGVERGPFETLVRASPDGILLLNSAGNILFANAAAQRLFGVGSSSLEGHFLGIPWLEDDTVIRVPASSGRVFDARSCIVEWEGSLAQLVHLSDVTSHVAAEERGAALVSELLEVTQKLGRDATVDPLTSVLNRRGLEDALSMELSRARRTGNALAALLIDCDDFKRINDTYGHAMGDVALRTVADTATSTLRPQDRLGRVGGDEFLVLLPDTQAAAAVQVGERILRALGSRPLPAELCGHRVTVSIGVAPVPASVANLERVIGSASRPLKMAKGRGKHRVWLAQDAASADTPSSDDAARLLLAPGNLRVVSQRIHDMSDSSVRGHELLVRGPRGELEQPRALFECARNLAVLERLDLECLRANLRACQRFDGPRLHINLLPSTLFHPEDLVRLVDAASLEIPLCFEVDEREIVGDPGRLRAAREVLRQRGIAFALDNVEFGRSALESLVVLEPDIMKVGLSLVSHISRDEGHARDLKRLVAVARSLGVDVLALGVESSSDLETLLGIGIQLGQGFLWDRPSAPGLPVPV